MRRILVFASAAFLFLAFWSDAETKITLSYRYPGGVVKKDFSTETAEVAASYDSKLLGIDGLEKLEHLRSVRLVGLDSLSDLRMLLVNPHLETIVLDGLISLKNIDSLFGISSLKALMVRSCPGLANNRPIQIDLRETQMIEFVGIADSGLFEPPILKNIPDSLRYLNLSANRFTSYAPFERIPGRIRVYLFGNPMIGETGHPNIIMDIGRFGSEVPRKYLATY